MIALSVKQETRVMMVSATEYQIQEVVQRNVDRKVAGSQVDDGERRKAAKYFRERIQVMAGTVSV